MKILESKVGFEAIGGMPLIVSYLQRLNFIGTIDDMVEPLRSNNRRMSHGETCFVMILFFLFRPNALYKMEDWIAETTYLRSLFPGIKSEYFNDDRLGDTLDALYKCGGMKIFSAQSIQAIKEFNLKVDQVHVDLTNFSVFGDYNKDEGINITYGKPKSGLSDLKQYALEAAVLDEGGIPIVQSVLDGNTADVTRYVPMWLGIKEVLGSTDFMLVGDCKLTSQKNLATISQSHGYYLGPLAMYKTLEEDLKRFVLEEKRETELLLEIKKSETLTVSYHGFETNDWVMHPETKQAFFQRKIFVLSSQLRQTELHTLDNHIKKADEDLEKLKEKLNTAKYNTKELIDAAIEKILFKHKLPQNVLTCNVLEHTETIKKKIGKGRAGPKTKYSEEVVTKYSMEISKNEDVIEVEKKLCGYFVLTTNKEQKDLSTKEALIAYKKEWQVERIFERLKGKLQILPIHLKLPHRIESLMFLLMTCTQVFTLIDLTAKKTLEKENRKLEGLFPNKIKVARPKTEYMLDALRNIGLVYTVQGNEFSVKVTGISTLQSEILKITQTDLKYVTTESIVKMLDIAEGIDGVALSHAIRTKLMQKDSDTVT